MSAVRHVGTYPDGSQLVVTVEGGSHTLSVDPEPPVGEPNDAMRAMERWRSQYGTNRWQLGQAYGTFKARYIGHYLEASGAVAVEPKPEALPAPEGAVF